MRQRNRQIFWIVFLTSTVVFIANLGAIIDTIFHPEIEYFDAEHIVVGSITGVIVGMILLLLIVYIEKNKNMFQNIRHSEESLRESAESYRTIFESSYDAILLMSPDGKILAANFSACRLFERTEEELLQLGRDGLIDVSGSTGQTFDEHASSGKFSGELLFIRKSGTRFTGEVSTSIFKDKSGELKTSMIIRDITDRKQAEEALQNERLLLRTVIDNIPDSIYAKDFSCRKTLANAAEVRFLGMQSEQEVLGKNDFDHYPKEFADKFFTDDQSVLQSGNPVVNREELILNGKGEKRWLISSKLPLRNNNNDIIGLVGIGRDVTDHKLAEEALQNKERYQRALLDNFPFAVWLKDTECRFLAVNQVFVNTFGAASTEALVGKSDFDIASYEDAEGYQADDRSVLETRQKKVAEEEIVDHGVRKWYETYKAPVIGIDNTLLGTVGFTRDISERKRAEEALRLSEKFLRETQTIAGLGTYTMDIVSGKWESSEILDSIFGIDSGYDKSVSGWASIIHPEWQKIMTEYFTREVIGNKSRFDKEYKIIRLNDSSERWVYGIGELKFNSAGEPITMVGTIKDITERKRAEEAMMQERNLLRTLIDNLPDKVHLKNNKLQYQLNNIVHLRTLGLKNQEESIGKSIWDFYPLANVQKQVGEEQEIIRSGIPKLEYEEQFFDREKNDYQWYLTSKVPVRDHRNAIVGLLTISRNITDSKKTADALRENEQKFRTLFENMTEGVALHEMIYDGEKAVDYRIIDINPAYEKHTGLSQIQARGLLASELYGTGTPPYFEEFASVALTGTPIMFETFFPPLDRHFHIGVISPGKGLFATVFEDITERKRKEQELQEKNSELERFTYTVSHDLKSPLITIKGFSGGLLKDLSAGRTDRFETDLKRIADAANKMNGLLEDLLELSRIGRIVNPPSDIAMDVLVQEVVTLLSGSITKSDAKVIIQEGLPVVRADRRRLFEVIQNLIENALKFTGDQAEPRIEIGMKEENNERIFFVLDNGRGIDPRYHETIFGLFNKLDASSSGTGIGLALARRIIEVHGGKIWVESDGINRGSTFYFTLPPKTKG